MSSKTIVCFGDSNTHGYDSSTGGRFSEKERWTCLLQEMLPSDYLIREEGLSGRTTSFSDPLFEGLDGISYIYPCLMTHEPVDLLIIMLGTNDTKERFSATAKNITQGLERLILKAKSTVGAWKNTPNILVIAPPAIEDAYRQTDIGDDMGDGCAEKSRALAPLYKKAAELHGCAFLDAGSIDGVSMAPYDWMHLSKDSHRVLAERLSKLIPELIEK